MRALVAVVALSTMVTGMASPAAAASGRFDDDDGRPPERALEWLAERGVIDGCDPPLNDNSCSDRLVTRAEAAKILVRVGQAEGVLAADRPGDVDQFADDDATWNGAAEPFIDHLADLGVVHGCDPPDNRHFCPDDTLLRGQITKMVVRAFGLSAPEGYGSPWEDTAGQFFHEAARVAAHHGLYDASAGLFRGFTKVTRGEFARVVVRVFEPALCSEDPFTAGLVSELESQHEGVTLTAYAYDFDTGCAYALNPQLRAQTASVFKLTVMAGTLLEAQSGGRSLTSVEKSWLEAMITESANPPVRDLWRSFGGAPWFARQAEVFGLHETEVVGDYEPTWGRTRTSAYDQGDLLRQLLIGEGGLLTEPARETAFDLMTSVVPSQTWGATEGVPPAWMVAQKNGFAGQSTNSVGVVYDQDLEPVYVVVVLTHGWSAWPDGISAVERISGWVAGALAD